MSGERCPRCQRHNARGAVWHAIRAGRLPPVTARACIDCGAPARHYDHHHGYTNALDVVPVCTACHGARTLVRGEARARGNAAARCETCPTKLTPMRLEPEMLALLDELAAQLDMTRTDVVRFAVRELAARR